MSDYATHLSPDRKVDLLGILEDLAADGLIGHKQKSELLEHPLRRASDRKRHPLIVISERGWVDQRSPSHKLHLEYLVEWLARRSGLPYHRINPRHMDMTRITTVIPYAYAARTNILPVKIDKDEIVIATDEPYSREWERELTPIFKQKITRVLANPNDIRRHLIELYTLARAVTHNLQNVNRAAPGSLQNLEHLMELGRAGELQADDQAVVSIVDWLLQYAFDSRASDIHLEPRRDLSNIRFRIDGVMHDVYQLPAAVMTTAISRLKILARMDLAEKRRPQDGRIKTRSPEGREVEMRVSSMPTAFGEKLVMRVFDPGMVIKDFCELGFADDDGRRWEKMIQQPSGIVVVTGPTGSGKTTTLYSSLKQLAVPEVNVCTIEDPIELVEPLFNQMQVQPSIDLTFADGVRALLRQDPDIIMIGEIRDLETAETAMQAAMTGHLVLSTMHTNDALSTITRLLDLGVPAYMIKANLVGVVAQRLARKLCPHCRAPVAVETATWNQACAGWKLPKPEHVYEAVGCLECRGTGYRGRTGVYEIMLMSEKLRMLLTDHADLDQLREVATSEGMVPLGVGALRKVAAGVTSIEEAQQSAPPPPLQNKK